jgi:hypothetical protein
MIEHIKDHRNKIKREGLKDAKNVFGIAEQLHVEIGLVNNALESFYNFVEEPVEVTNPEEQMACNSMILSDVALVKGKGKIR